MDLGFFQKLRERKCLCCELWGFFFQGLKFVLHKGIDKVTIQVDSKVVVKAINGDKVGNFVGWILVLQIRHLIMATIPHIRLVHIFREGNGLRMFLRTMHVGWRKTSVFLSNNLLCCRSLFLVILLGFFFLV